MKKIIVLVVLLCLLLTACVPVPTISNIPVFYPTIEEAFARRVEGLRRDMGEILLIDEHEDNLTIIHNRRGVFYDSHFVREMREDKAWYSCVGIGRGWGILIDPPSTSTEMQQTIIFSHLRLISRIHDELNRRPLTGISMIEQVHNLTINGQAPDHIILLQETPLLYFWYIADFQAEVNSPSDIVICFGEDE